MILLQLSANTGPAECCLAVRYALEALMREGAKAVRASGPGGQHVNKTSSAIRATHIASGLSVKVQAQRSQLANKRLAAALLAGKLAAAEAGRGRAAQAALHAQHTQVERGNARRAFVGKRFIEAG